MWEQASLFVAMLHNLWDLFPDQGSNLHPLQWTHSLNLCATREVPKCLDLRKYATVQGGAECLREQVSVICLQLALVWLCCTEGM